MAGGREVRSKIASVKNTRKVTRALEMVSASKIRKAQDLMLASRPYTSMMKRVIGHIAQADPEYRHPFMRRREVKRVGVVLVSTDRGLCGGLNTNLFRKTVVALREWEAADIDVDMVTIGTKGEGFFKRLKVNVVGAAHGLGETPRVEDLIGVIKIMLDAYSEGRIDALYLAFNDFINTMTQKPDVEPLLPLPPVDVEELQDHWDYLYEPEAREVLDDVMTRYVESLVYQGVLENLASEHAARMVAMKSASDNANNLIDELQLVYNKARQAAITQEISEIVGGAAAV